MYKNWSVWWKPEDILVNIKTNLIETKKLDWIFGRYETSQDTEDNPTVHHQRVNQYANKANPISSTKTNNINLTKTNIINLTKKKTISEDVNFCHKTAHYPRLNTILLSASQLIVSAWQCQSTKNTRSCLTMRSTPGILIPAKSLKITKLHIVAPHNNKLAHKMIFMVPMRLWCAHPRKSYYLLMAKNPKHVIILNCASSVLLFKFICSEFSNFPRLLQNLQILPSSKWFHLLRLSYKDKVFEGVGMVG